MLQPWCFSEVHSQELYAIERIWKELHARIGRRCPTTLAELQKIALEEWANFPQSLIDSHCLHFVNHYRVYHPWMNGDDDVGIDY